MQIAKILFIIITGAALLGGCGPSKAELAKDKLPTAARAVLFILALAAVLFAIPADNAKADEQHESISLHQAVWSGNLEMIKHLLTVHEVDINALGLGDAGTALHIAVFRNQPDMVTILLDNGADANAKKKDGGTPLNIALSRNLFEITEILGSRGATATFISDVEARDSIGRTRLYHAAGWNAHHAVVELVKLGANVNALGKNSSTPLHQAARGNAANAVAELVKNGANLEAKETRLGFTPLHRAALNSSLDALVALLDSGANIESQDAYGSVPLHIAAGIGASKIADELVKRGANINAVDKDGRTPVEYAISENKFDLANKLQEAAQQAREIPQESTKSIFPTAKTEAGGVFESIWRSVVVVEAGNSQGSGVALKPNLVATNCHVTDAATSPIAVYKGENRRADKSKSYPARVVAGDRQRDVCLLAVEGVWAIPAEARNAAEMQIAEQVYAVGAPRGLDFSISGGLVSQLREEEGSASPLIQTDTAISPGSSGGGLFDAKGKLVGLTTFGYRDSEGLNFAVPIEWALELIPNAEQ